MKKIIAIQMFGNKNESFASFKESVKALVNDGFIVEAITTENQASVLGDVKGVNVHTLNNNHQPNKVFKLYMFVKIQIQLFVKVLKMIGADDVVYINSIYSIAPAIVAKMKHAKLVCHLHSVKQTAGIADRILKFLINKMADQVIFPSVSLKDKFALSVAKQTVVYNTPADEFINEINPLRIASRAKKFTVLMIASSDDSLATGRFTELATCLPLINFELLINDWTIATAGLLDRNRQPANLRILPENNNIHRFYERADVLINLSASEFNTAGDIDVLQAMYYGIPVIVPAKGGLRELISTGKHGVAVDSNQLTTIAQTIQELSGNALIYKTLSAACISQAKLFTSNQFRVQFTKLFNGHRARPYDNLIQLFGTAYLNNDISVFKSKAA
jgi:glycosyltransferase involved in cell wall biosynthesis